jgi:hypothetical protein
VPVRQVDCQSTKPMKTIGSRERLCLIAGPLQ